MDDRIIVPVGMGMEGDRIVFWALDTSCMRLFIIKQSEVRKLGKAAVREQLADFLGVDDLSEVDLRRTMDEIVLNQTILNEKGE